jgi:hypothetical protein
MATFIIALVGLAIFIWGMALFVAFGIAGRVFARLQSTSAYTAVKENETVKAGEALVDRAVEAVPNAFVRRLIRNVVPEGSDMTGTVVTGIIEGKRSAGGWLAVLGAVIFAGSFVAGPWLHNLIARG